MEHDTIAKQIAELTERIHQPLQGLRHQTQLVLSLLELIRNINIQVTL